MARIIEIPRYATVRSGEKLETDHAGSGSGQLEVAEFVAAIDQRVSAAVSSLGSYTAEEFFEHLYLQGLVDL